jgi:hypothetical protein
MITVSALEPTPGLYRMPLRRGGVRVAVKIWYGAPLDPVTRDEMDRGHRWQALANDDPVDFERVWPVCAKEPIDQAEYDHLVRLARWSKQNAPDAPHANPRRPVNYLTAPLPF